MVIVIFKGMEFFVKDFLVWEFEIGGSIDVVKLLFFFVINIFGLLFVLFDRLLEDVFGW